MTRKAFFDHAQRWHVAEVQAALAADPGLARATDRIGMTALHRCARTRLVPDGPAATASIETARALLDAGAEVGAVREIPDGGEVFRATALWYALAWGLNRDLVRFLAERGGTAENCVWAVLFQEDLEMADLLLPHGLELDARFDGKTALVESVIGNRYGSVAWLLAHGADPNLGDNDGWTPLHHAVKRGHSAERVAMLLASGARGNAEARDGTTPLSLARALGKRRLAEVLSG
jgi:ankyrin repeat protein